MAAQMSYLDQMVSSRAKAKSPEAVAQRAHDVKAVAAMKARLAKSRPKVRKGYTGEPVPMFQSRCAGDGEKIQSRTANGGIYTYESKGHKCPDLF